MSWEEFVAQNLGVLILLSVVIISSLAMAFKKVRLYLFTLVFAIGAIYMFWRIVIIFKTTHFYQ